MSPRQKGLLGVKKNEKIFEKRNYSKLTVFMKGDDGD